MHFACLVHPQCLQARLVSSRIISSKSAKASLKSNLAGKKKMKKMKKKERKERKKKKKKDHDSSTVVDLH